MATEDLIRLIDLSLGAQPQGVVNFNYLHDLMHGIVRRLGSLTDVEPPRSWNARYVSGKERRGKDTVRDRTEDPRKVVVGVAADDRGKGEMPEGSRGKDGVSGGSRGKDGVSGGSRGKDGVTENLRGKDGMTEGSQGKDGVTEGSQGKDRVTESSRGKDGVTEGSRGGGVTEGSRGDGVTEGSQGKDGVTEASRGKDGVTEASQGTDGVAETSQGKDGAESSQGKDGVEGKGEIAKDSRGKDGVTESRSSAKRRDTIDGEGDQDGFDSREDSAPTSPKQQFSRSSIRQYTSRPGLYVSAANDISAMERKLVELERRVNTMESLPEMLERMAADSGATPVSDMWNFTNLHRRLTATEDGLGKVSTMHNSVSKPLNMWHGLLS